MLRLIPLALLVLQLAACGATEPYVYKANEFDRDRPSFNRSPADPSEVGICYNGMTTTPEKIRALAEEHCQAYGKRARLADEVLASCPLLTPAGAMFRCVK